MRKIFFIVIIASLFGCKLSKENSATDPIQTYILVDAKVKVYHDDGTRSYEDYKPFKTRTVELLAGYKRPNRLPLLNKYGGLLEGKSDATGFYYVKKIGDRWWGIDPSGSRYMNLAINSITVGKTEDSRKALIEKFDTKENWLKETILLMQNNGFNCVGSWSDVEAIREYNKTADKPMAYTINWDFMSSYGKKRGGTFQEPGHTGYPNGAIFAFDPEFETFCDEHAKHLVEFKDDPNLFGHFSDNEMPFKIKALDNYLTLPKDNYGYLAATQWLEQQGITENQITDEHREAFMAFVGDKYFSVVSKAIKKYDPNHMYIGSRFYGSEKDHEQFMRAAGKYLDVVTNNYYNQWTPDSAHVKNWTNWTGKPFIVTEYYTKGEDSGMGNTSGAGWIVRTQKDRGLFYQNFTLALLESKNCVGWHYFKYQDNDPNAKGVDPSNLDANKGIVNCKYELWEPMMNEMGELNTQVYNLIDYFDN
jgi:hypothetical protein